MKFFVFTVLLAKLCCDLACAEVVLNSESSGLTFQNDVNFTMVGNSSVEGKTYYNEATERTWFEAGEICQENGMQLARITTQVQWNFLVDNWSVDFSGSHWTAGRDAQVPGAFTWNNLGLPPAEQVIDFGGVDIPYQLCITYWSVTFLSRTHAEFCTDKFPVLCEALEQ